MRWPRSPIDTCSDRRQVPWLRLLLELAQGFACAVSKATPAHCFVRVRAGGLALGRCPFSPGCARISGYATQWKWEMRNRHLSPPLWELTQPPPPHQPPTPPPGCPSISPTLPPSPGEALASATAPPPRHHRCKKTIFRDTAGYRWETFDTFRYVTGYRGIPDTFVKSAAGIQIMVFRCIPGYFGILLVTSQAKQ